MSKNLSNILNAVNTNSLPAFGDANNILISTGTSWANSAIKTVNGITLLGSGDLVVAAAQATLNAANNSANGYLTSTDWTTFNNKQATLISANNSANGYLTSADWTTFNNKQATLNAANNSANGYLTSTDWTTFNNKQATLISGTSIKTVNGASLLGSGDVTISSGTSIGKIIALASSLGL